MPTPTRGLPDEPAGDLTSDFAFDNSGFHHRVLARRERAEGWGWLLAFSHWR
jgi:hypothetical protein